VCLICVWHGLLYRLCRKIILFCVVHFLHLISLVCLRFIFHSLTALLAARQYKLWQISTVDYMAWPPCHHPGLRGQRKKERNKQTKGKGSVDIATGWKLIGAGIFLITNSKPALGPTLPPTSRRRNQSENETNQYICFN